MATRKPATAEEIIEVLRVAQTHKGRAVPYISMVAEMRRVLHTNSRKAGEWLVTATGEEPHEFELIGTSAGRIRYVWRIGKDLLLNEAGYTDNRDDQYWPQLTWQGEPVSKDPDAGDQEFVVFSKDLHAMCEQADENTKRRRAVRQRLQNVARDGAEERHGDSIAYFQGLLKMAGIEISDGVFGAKFRDSFSGGYTSLNLTLMDDQIDAVGNVLAAHGIEPDPPVEIVTRKPLP